MTKRHRVPVWLMGLTNLTYGLYGGVVAFAVPQILSLRHVPEAEIASLTAVAFSPGFWSFLFSPALDVRFSRRWYAVALAMLASVTVLVAFLNLDNFLVLEIALTAGFFAAYLSQSAIGGWVSNIIDTDEENELSIWITVANTTGFSIMAICCNQLVSRMAPLPVALVLSALIMVPCLPMPFMQAPGPDRRLAKESFGQFFGDVVSLVKRREVLIAIALFAAPVGTFSLTNYLGGRGGDFHASPGFVGLIGGVGVAAAGFAGCFLFAPLRKLLPLRPLYICVGAVGAATVLGLILLPRTPMGFAISLIAVNVFQSLAITTSNAITFDVIGRGNPLASTTFCVINSAYGVPISYMLYMDSFGYGRGGIGGSFAADAMTGLAASGVMGLMLLWLAKRRARRS